MTTAPRIEQAIAELEAGQHGLSDQTATLILQILLAQLAKQQAQPDATSVHRLATILHIEISGLTSMYHQTDAEKTSERVLALWSVLDRVIIDNGGLVDKHLDNILLAYWGLGTTSEDDPMRAITAGLRLLAHINQIDGIHCRITISTGPVVTGLMTANQERIVMGDTVEIVRYLKDNVEHDQVIITHETYQHVRGLVDVEMIGSLFALKGKRTPTRLYRVEGHKPFMFRLARFDFNGIETRMIGREPILLQLQAVFRQTLDDRQPLDYVITAEAGLGKSRLLTEFLAWIELLPNYTRFFFARPTPQTLYKPYGLVREMLFSRFGILYDEPLSAAQSKLVEGVQSFLPGADGERVAHLLGRAIGLDFARSPYLQDLENLPSREVVQAALVDLLVASRLRRMSEEEPLEEETPVLLVLEDLHWADLPSLKIIEHVLQTVEIPLFVLGAGRPAFFDRLPDWADHHRRIDLQPLSPEQSGELADELLQRVDYVPPALRQTIIDRAEGNPYFMEEFVKYLIESGTIRITAEQWQINNFDADTLETPATLVTLLRARLDALNPANRRVLQVASVMGRRFTVEGLAAMFDHDAYNLPMILMQLVGHSLINRSERAPVPEYSFKHNVLQSVAYESLLKRDRQRYHARLAGWFQAQTEGRANTEIIGQIAEHFARSNEPGKAVPYLLQAGDNALDLRFVRDALRYYQQADAIVTDAETVALVKQKIGHANSIAGDYAAAVAVLHDGLEVTMQTTRRAHLLEILAGVQWAQGDLEAAQDTLHEAFDLAEDDSLVAKLHWHMSIIYWHRGNLEASHVDAEKSYKMYETLGDLSGASRAMIALGLVAYARGDYQAAANHFRQTMERASQSNLNTASMAEANLGASLERMGHYDEAWMRVQHALLISNQHGYERTQAYAHLRLGSIALHRDGPAAARVHFHETLYRLREIDAQSLILNTLIAIAEWYLATEQPARAVQLLGFAITQPLDQMARIEADELMKHIQAEVDPDMIQQEKAAGATLDYSLLLETLLQELSA
jgi:class 3 adenylate cyclase/tetratricopeptide (TPR) repeat protein